MVDYGEYKLIKKMKYLRFREGSGYLSGEGGDGGVNRVHGFPVTAHHGVVEFFAALHKIFVPLLHVTFRDGLFYIIFIYISTLLMALCSSRHVSGWHPHGRWWHCVARWGVSVGRIVIVVATVIATVVAAGVAAAVVAAVLVVAPPLRVVTPLTSAALVAVVTGLGRAVVAMVILALAPVVVAHLLALCHSNTESERLSPQHRTLALLDRLLLLALLPKLDKAVAFLT